MQPERKRIPYSGIWSVSGSTRSAAPTALGAGHLTLLVHSPSKTFGDPDPVGQEYLLTLDDPLTEPYLGSLWSNLPDGRRGDCGRHGWQDPLGRTARLRRLPCRYASCLADARSDMPRGGSMAQAAHRVAKRGQIDGWPHTHPL